MRQRAYEISPGGGYDPYNSAVTHPTIVMRMVELDLAYSREPQTIARAFEAVYQLEKLKVDELFK